MTSQIQSDTQISGAAVAVFLILLAAGLALAAVFGTRLPIFAGVLAGLYFLLFPSSTVSAGASISACG